MVGTAVGSVSCSPRRATPAYGVDSFSEYSSFAVSRTATTKVSKSISQLSRSNTREEDEELFRDLFANEHDWETQEGRTPALAVARIKPHHPIWSKGPILTSTNDTKNSQPTLSAPVPRLNLAELMTARPDAFDPSDTSWNLGLLGSVSESRESDDDDEDGSGGGKEFAGPETHSRKLQIPPMAPLNSKKNMVLQQETLSFLERLDLKTLLNTPRPDVLNFFPPSTNAVSVAMMGSARVEEDPPSARPANNNNINNKQLSDNCSTRGFHEPNAVDPALARLAFIETAYGTSRAVPRKARKETFDRLSNPIAGYSATLLALSPELRRKREALDASENDGFKNRPGPAVTKSKAPKTSSLLDHLGRSVSIYEAVATASSSTRKLYKPEKPQVRRLSNNQLDDMREAHGQASNSRKSKGSSRTAGSTPRKPSIRHQRMNQPVTTPRERTANSLKNDTDRSNCTTFLTQPEELEADATRRLVPFRPTGPPKIPKAIATALPSTRARPIRRLSVSSTKQMTPTSLPSVLPKTRRRAADSRTTVTKSREESTRGRTSRIESSSKPSLAAATSTIRAKVPNRPPAGGSNRMTPSDRPLRLSARRGGSQPPPPKVRTPDGAARRRPNSQLRTPKQTPTVSSSAMLLMGTAATTTAAPSPHGRRGQSNRQQVEPGTPHHAAKRNNTSSTPQKRTTSQS